MKEKDELLVRLELCCPVCLMFFEAKRLEVCYLDDKDKVKLG